MLPAPLLLLRRPSFFLPGMYPPLLASLLSLAYQAKQASTARSEVLIQPFLHQVQRLGLTLLFPRIVRIRCAYSSLDNARKR